MTFDPQRLRRLDRHLDAYVADGRLPGYALTISQGGEPVHVRAAGARDMEAGLPVEPDTLWRIYSMTKPVTSVAAMRLWEEGAFELKDPVARFLPAFGDMRVFRGGSDLKPVTEPAQPMLMWHLLTHTSGLTYGFHRAHPVDAMYRAAGFEWTAPPGLDLAACCDRWAELPLLFHPGAEWNYGASTDVLGRVCEVISGDPLDEFLAETVLRPLQMPDTAFSVPPDDASRLAALYSPDPAGGPLLRNDPLGDLALHAPDCLLGGGGLVSSASDYQRFAQMLLNGGELDGIRLLGPRTLSLMTVNQLPGRADLEGFGRPLYAETTFDGVGFGLGFSVVQDPVVPRYPVSVGEFGWGGAASTVFWVDPAEDMIVLFLTQVLPSTTYPLRSQLHQLVHQALLDPKGQP